MRSCRYQHIHRPASIRYCLDLLAQTIPATMRSLAHAQTVFVVFENDQIYLSRLMGNQQSRRSHLTVANIPSDQISNHARSDIDLRHSWPATSSQSQKQF